MADQERRFRIEFADETKKEFQKLGRAATVEILAAIDKKLTTDPEAYGEPLRAGLKGHYKLAVGQWRVVYLVEDQLVTVLVLAVGKRAEGDRENIYGRITGDDLAARRTSLGERLGLGGAFAAGEGLESSSSHDKRGRRSRRKP